MDRTKQTASLPPVVFRSMQEFSRICLTTKLWSGFDPKAVPLVLHGGDRAYLIGHPSPPEGFRFLGKAEGGSVCEGPSSREMTANTAQLVGGALSALAALPDDAIDPAAYARLLLHECFHVFQQQGLAKVALPDFRQMARYPENDPINNALAVIENRLLVAALGHDKTATARFLAVRLYRQSRLGSELVAYETGQEFNEGTPTYIEVKAGKPETELGSALAQCNVGGRWAAYQRFYFTGSSIALLLDGLMSHWQRRLAEGGVTLQGLLQEVAGPLPAVEAVLSEAEYAAVLAEEQQREAERLREIVHLRAELESGPGYRVEVDTANTPYLAWDPTRCLVVEPGVRLHTRWLCLQNGSNIQIELNGLCLEDRGRQVVITRVAASPVITTREPFCARAPGLKAEAPCGHLEPLDDGFRIRLW